MSHYIFVFFSTKQFIEWALGSRIHIFAICVKNERTRRRITNPKSLFEGISLYLHTSSPVDRITLVSYMYVCVAFIYFLFWRCVLPFFTWFFTNFFIEPASSRFPVIWAHEDYVKSAGVPLILFDFFFFLV